ncbi:unnamed protein product [Orchesella dallaii]|uniref:Uncharacterized protein n=1 Tax=Orchesella dallaii TaxID=48710 RepID=A0ABP1S7Y7_9HEXA
MDLKLVFIGLVVILAILNVNGAPFSPKTGLGFQAELDQMKAKTAASNHHHAGETQKIFDKEKAESAARKRLLADYQKLVASMQKFKARNEQVLQELRKWYTF